MNASRLFRFLSATMLAGTLGVLLAGPLGPRLAWAQASADAIRIAIPENGPVHVYHTMRLPLGHGIHVYREDGAGGASIRLTDQPVYPAASPHEFMAEVGPVFDYVRLALERDDPQAIFFTLRADRIAAGMLSFLFPEVASAMGRLVVDREAPIGARVTYRVVVVDSEGEETGQALTATETLTPMRPQAPLSVEAEHEADMLTISWRYPEVDIRTDDRVMRFDVLRHLEGSTVALNATPIVRYANIADYDLLLRDLTVGDTLRFSVVAYDVTGQQGVPSEVMEYVITDNTPPEAVTDVETIVSDAGQVEILWRAVSDIDVAGYHVYRTTSLAVPFERVTDELVGAGGQRFVDFPPGKRRAFFYSVTAVDHAGNEGTFSTAAVAHVEDHEPPPAPVDLRATYTDAGTVRLTWGMSQDVADLQSFVVLRREETPGVGRASVQINEADFVSTEIEDRGEAGRGFADGAFYRYSVLAADSARNFSDSVHVMIQIPDTTPPDPPSGVVASNVDGIYVGLIWQAPHATDVSEYHVYRRESEGAGSVLVARIPVAERYYRDDDVLAGREYEYTVAAMDSLGNVGISGDPAVVRVTALNPPREVRNVTVQPVDGAVEIRWEHVTSPDVLAYHIYRADSPTGLYQLLAVVDADRQTHTDPEGAGKWYRVSAVDTSRNEGKPSVPVQARTGP
jgi:fibronectin type 3 domain-containing protein